MGDVHGIFSWAKPESSTYHLPLHSVRNLFRNNSLTGETQASPLSMGKRNGFGGKSFPQKVFPTNRNFMCTDMKAWKT